MSLLSWFAPRKRADHMPSALPSSGLSRMDSTRPFHAARSAGGGAQPANRKQERMARRELLYAVVRESMVRAGVLTSSYKFKVLSLDARGRQFLIMVDLAQGAGIESPRLAEIEAMVAQSAKSRYDILVTALYWRANEHVAVGEVAVPPPRAAVARPAIAVKSVPQPTEEPSQPAELHPAEGPRAEPLHPAEVAAFRKVLAASVRGEEALAAAGPRGHQAHSYTLLTGFEDTEMAEGGAGASNLSGTQYGELR